MALVLYKEVPIGRAALFCNATAAGRLICNMLAAPRSRPDECAFILYDSTAPGKGGVSNEWDLAKFAYVVFAKNKRTLERGLRARPTKVIAPQGYVSVLKNNYTGIASQIGNAIFLPLDSLFKKIQADWRIFQNAGGLFRPRHNEVENEGRVDIVKSGPLEYTSYVMLANSIRRVNAARSGYYILICQPIDIVDHTDIVGKRCYTVEKKTVELQAIATLIGQ